MCNLCICECCNPILKMLHIMWANKALLFFYLSMWSSCSQLVDIMIKSEAQQWADTKWVADSLDPKLNPQVIGLMYFCNVLYTSEDEDVAFGRADQYRKASAYCQSNDCEYETDSDEGRSIVPL